MSKITLEPNSLGSGTFTLSAPNSNNNRTFVIPDADGELLTTQSPIGPEQLTGLPTGAVIQVKQTQKIDVFSTSTNTYVNITGLSVDITPSSSLNKILIISTITASSTTNSDW